MNEKKKKKLGFIRGYKQNWKELGVFFTVDKALETTRVGLGTVPDNAVNLATAPAQLVW